MSDGLHQNGIKKPVDRKFDIINQELRILSPYDFLTDLRIGVSERRHCLRFKTNMQNKL